MKGIRKYKTFEEAQFDTYVFEPNKTYFDMVFSMFSISLLDKIGKKVKKKVSTNIRHFKKRRKIS